MLKIILALNILMTSVCSFVIPYGHWHCIDFVKNIDKNKPYAFNVGELPLVTWFNNTQPITTLNICNHMGSKLDKGKITSDGCLICPYHAISHTCEDAMGKSIIFQDKLWWAYDPIEPNPPRTPYYENKKFSSTFFTLDINANIKDCMLNTFDIHNFASILGHKELPKEYKIDKLNNNKMSVSYKYRDNIKNNFHIFHYPYTSSAIFSLSNKEKLIVHIDMLPKAIDKTRWIITLKHNFWYSYFERLKIEMIISYILFQNKEQLAKQTSENILKQNIMQKNEEHFKYLRQIYTKYKFPDMYSAIQLYEYHKNKETYHNINKYI